jgi:acyl-[acyl-carrier-protein] desaturase
VVGIDSDQLFRELTPQVEHLVDRHLSASREWFPHEMIPWERASAKTADPSWDPAESELSEGARAALEVNLLTEDNLPYYFREGKAAFGLGEVWEFWMRRWTAEEARHSVAIRDYVTVTRAIDPVALERDRMAQMTTGWTLDADTPLEGLVYVSLQELATRHSHRNTGLAMADKAGYDVLARVAADENLHHRFYRDVVEAALEVDPSAVVEAMDVQVPKFEMPGYGIPRFSERAAAIAREGIYDFAVHLEHILLPVLKKNWRLESLTGLTADAERARDRVLRYLARLERVAVRLKERRAASCDGSDSEPAPV